MITKILIGVAVAFAVFLIVVALQPSKFQVTRSTTIAALPRQIFPHVNELRQWEVWNPWGKMDPDMKLTYEGPSSGVGAIYRWEGNAEVGAGSCTITGSKPDDLVQIRLDFLKPFRGTSTADFIFQPEGGQTKVTWTMAGTKNFFSKAFSLFMSMDKMIGSQFERGLADLKAVAEQVPAA